jgi:hypothetical protein
MNKICPKCGAVKTTLKCDFCGSEQELDERRNNESSSKIIAEREFSIGNYKESLKHYNILYSEYPNDIYVISKRAFCLCELQEINLENYGMYLEQVIALTNDQDTFRSVVKNFLSFALQRANISLLHFISSKSLNIIFENKNFYTIFLEILKWEENRSLASDLYNGTLVSMSDDIYLKMKYEDTFIFFSRIKKIKDSVDISYYKEILKILQIENKLNYSFETRNGFDILDKSRSKLISEEEFIDLVRYNINGRIPNSIFKGYFDWERRNHETSYDTIQISNIIKKWDIRFDPIKGQFEQYMQDIFATKMPEQFYLGNKNINWCYSSSMDADTAVSKIREICENGERKRRGSTKCFIATATMGSYNHPVVVDLRIFRDQWLQKRNWGKYFIQWYYIYGAKAAMIIGKSNILRKVSLFTIIKPLHFIIKRIIK